MSPLLSARSLGDSLSRWLLQPSDAFLYGLLRLFFGISGVCKFTGLTSPIPRLVQGGFNFGLPLHRYKAGNFAPGVLASDWLPAPSYDAYCNVEGAALVVAVFVACGVFSRFASLVFAGCCWWLLLVDQARANKLCLKPAGSTNNNNHKDVGASTAFCTEPCNHHHHKNNNE